MAMNSNNYSLGPIQPISPGYGGGYNPGLGMGGSGPSMAPANPIQPLSLSAPSATSGAATAAQGAGSLLGAISPWMPVVGTVGSLLLSGAGMWLQNKYNKEAQEKADYWANMQNALQAREREKQWDWLEEDRRYQRANDFLTKWNNMVTQNKQFQNNIVSLWRKAA